jgi:hypothetical protein
MRRFQLIELHTQPWFPARPQELRAIAEKLSASKYHWESGEQAAAHGSMPITYLIGLSGFRRYRVKSKLVSGGLVNSSGSPRSIRHGFQGV